MTAQPGIAGTADIPTASGPRLSEAAVRYADAKRRISRETLERLGVASGTAFFPTLGRSSEAVFFPYVVGGERVNWKAASFPDKAFTSQKGGKLAFFNLDRVIGSETIYITEGEWDAASLVEAGIPETQVISVPNGAREHKAEDDETPRGYGYVEEALKMGLGRAKRFVFCGDMDGPGFALRQDMARILGAARFWFVEWPDGCKDANDLLRSDGHDAVRDLVTNGALPWPVDGLYRLDEIPEPPPMTLWDPGFPEWEGKVRLAPGTMSVVTGHPGHGKTHLWAQIWFQVVRRHQVTACIASFETRVKPHHRRILRTLYTGKLEKDMGQAEARRADDWIRERYLWLRHPDQRPTLDWVLDMAEVAVVRHGAKILQIDPWNRLEGARPSGESETDYIGRCLTSLYVFAQDMDCHVQVLAHPAKMDQQRRGKAPGLEDIAGSKHWENRVDQGFVVHRPRVFEDGQRQTEAVLFHRKVRFDELGYDCKLNLELDLMQGRYVSTDYKVGLL